MEDIIGKRFDSKNSGYFTVLRKSEEKYKRAFLYEIEFEEINGVKYKSKVRKNNIIRGAIKNPYYPSVYNIGYLGKATRDENEFEYIRWKGVLSRCYNSNSKAYKYYGARGVAVCERWHSFENFLHDFPLLEGYDENNLKKLQLDKDIKVRGNKVYSPDTCILVSEEKNLNEMIKRVKQIKLL